MGKYKRVESGLYTPDKTEPPKPKRVEDMELCIGECHETMAHVCVVRGGRMGGTMVALEDHYPEMDAFDTTFHEFAAEIVKRWNAYPGLEGADDPER